MRKASLMRVMVHPRAGAAAARGHVLGPGAFSVSEENPSCESIVAADHEIKFGSDNVVIESRNGRCRETLAVYILLHSGTVVLSTSMGMRAMNGSATSST